MEEKRFKISTRMKTAWIGSRLHVEFRQHSISVEGVRETRVDWVPHTLPTPNRAGHNPSLNWTAASHMRRISACMRHIHTVKLGDNVLSLLNLCNPTSPSPLL